MDAPFIGHMKKPVPKTSGLNRWLVKINQWLEKNNHWLKKINQWFLGLSQNFMKNHQLFSFWARPCEKTGLKNQWFKPVVSENKSLVRKKLITGFKKLSSGFLDRFFHMDSPIKFM